MNRNKILLSSAIILLSCNDQMENTPQKEKQVMDSQLESMAVITCDHVLNGESPILFAFHDLDGDWQFLCGGNNHTENNAKVISLGNALDIDASLDELLNTMPIGTEAQRSAKDAKWNIFKAE